MLNTDRGLRLIDDLTIISKTGCRQIKTFFMILRLLFDGVGLFNYAAYLRRVLMFYIFILQVLGWIESACDFPDSSGLIIN